MTEQAPRQIGKLVDVNVDRQFAFILPDDGSSKLFTHLNDLKVALNGAKLRPDHYGLRVSFVATPIPGKRPHARYVTKA